MQLIVKITSMFKINIYVRFAIIAVCFIIGAISTYNSSFLNASPFFIVGIILLIGYFLLGTVTSTAEILQRGDIAAAEKNLNLTIKPEWLYTANRGYYYLMRGTIYSQKKDNAGAEAAFAKALEIGLPSDDETAMIHLQRASLAASKNKWNAAQVHFRNIKSLKVSEPQLKEQIRQFEKAFQQRGQMKHMNQNGGRGRRFF